MINSKLKYLARVFFVLVLSTYSVIAQNPLGKNTLPNNSGSSIVSRISGLSTTQQDQIRQLENGYHLVMGELRTQMQNATDLNEKSALRNEMAQMTQNHQNNIKRLLTKEQKKEYNKILAENKVRQTPQGRGKGKGQGTGGMRGSGQGRRY